MIKQQQTMATYITRNDTKIYLKVNGICEFNEYVTLFETIEGDLLLMASDRENLIKELGVENHEKDVDGLFVRMALPNMENMFIDLFESIQCNNDIDFHPDLGYSGFGLTEAPGFTTGFRYDDDGVYTDEPYGDGRLWHYNDYMIFDFMERLVNFGSVVFVEHKLR